MVAFRGMVLSLIAFRGFTHRKFTMNRRMADKSHTGREKKDKMSGYRKIINAAIAAFHQAFVCQKAKV